MNTEFITLAEAARLFPSRGGKPVTVATLRYRIKNGCRGVRLEGFLSGGTWFTTQAAIDRFHAALNARANPGVAPVRRVTSKAARDYLERLGINENAEKKTCARKPAAR